VPTAELAPVPDPTSFEPRVALNGGPDGLALYRRLFESLEDHAAAGCAAFLEAAPDTTGPLGRLAAQRFPDAAVRLLHDYSRRPRLVQIVWPR
jgi:release factor glutamine methyltransferase